MFEGDFREPEAFRQPTMAEGSRYKIADIYHLQVDPEVVLHVGIIPGWRVFFFILQTILINYFRGFRHVPHELCLFLLFSSVT